MLINLVQKNRSYRRFDHSYKIQGESLKTLIGLARFTPSSGNLQPLKYLPIHEGEQTDTVFRLLKWARYLQDWPGPSAAERPSAYIVLLGDTSIAQSFQVDSGIAAQTILLGAAEMGLGGCIVASVDREPLRHAFSIPMHLEILFVLALGRPAEQVVVETAEPGGDIKYYRTPDGRHHVPKRSLDELILPVTFRNGQEPQ
jgi:nitroreductase